MSKVTSITDWKNKQLAKQYTAYYGTPIDIQHVKRPRLTLVEKDIKIKDDAIEYDVSEYIELLQQEGIDTDRIEIIKPDPTIPW